MSLVNSPVSEKSLYVESVGQGPDVILLHGWGMHGAYWQALVDDLKENFCLHCIDLPGHGNSGYAGETGIDDFVNRISQTVEQISDGPVYVIGWSLGGLISQAWLRSAGERIKKLVLIASSPSFVQRAAWPSAMPRSVLQGFADNLLQDYKQTLSRFLALQVRGSEQQQQALRELKAQLFSRGEPDPQALNIGLLLLQQADLREDWSRMDIPVMLVGGERDTLVPSSALIQMAEQVDDVSLHIIKGAGHAPFLSHTHEVTPLIKAFFEHE